VTALSCETTGFVSLDERKKRKEKKERKLFLFRIAANGWIGTHNILYRSTHTHTHPFNGPLSRTTRVSRYQKGKTNLDFTEAKDSEWQWHQPGHMQVCISLQTDNHASTPPLNFFTGRMPFLPPKLYRSNTKKCNDRIGLYKQ